MYAPLSEERAKIIAKNPERYTVHIQEHVSAADSEQSAAPSIHVIHSTNYEVPSDGLVVIRVPSYRRDCGVYLFNWIRVGGGGDDALELRELTVLSGVRDTRALSLKQVGNLPTDAAGIHLLRISD